VIGVDKSSGSYLSVSKVTLSTTGHFKVLFSYSSTIGVYASSYSSRAMFIWVGKQNWGVHNAYEQAEGKCVMTVIIGVHGPLYWTSGHTFAGLQTSMLHIQMITDVLNS